MIVLFKADDVAVFLAADEDLTTARRIVVIAVAEQRGPMDAFAVFHKDFAVGDTV